MSLIMDNRLETQETEAEVVKLKQLVKELELQNEELRTERQQLKKDGINTPLEQPSAPGTPKKVLDGNLDTMVPLGLEEANMSDDETWLFDSPKTKPQESDWLRKDMDDPALLSCKKSLIHKLDQIALSPHHSPRHSFSPCSSSGVLSPESPPSSRGEIDTRTFVRGKKKRPPLAFGEAVSDENRNSLLKRGGSLLPCLRGLHESHPGTCNSYGSSREYLARSSGSLGSEEEDRLSSASDGSFSYQLTDVADVNALARLQEESIRGGSGLPSPHTYSSAGSGGSVTSSQEDLIAPPHTAGSPRRPARGLTAPVRYSAHNTPSREGSDLSTPPDSPYNSQHNLEYCNGRGMGSPSNMRPPGGLHRGFGGGNDPHHTPTSSRGGSPARSSPSASQTDLRQGAQRTSKLQAPQMRSRLSAPSPVRVPMGASGLPQPGDIRAKSSGIPRPGSRLQAPRARSGLAPPRFQTGSQEDWRDGCF
ncbi:SLAIN motif-containing protein 2 [Chionoecetes opilio]|uniref:SLAIN motif-containing protein 2 n=1 Tax=Chionoecetes opilio TaxID=41210 RepID=A0A8J4Y9L0_CHIOP|nr:SLAIN motif-containing protein 2 [Chionoecetes opilio]